VDEKLVRLLTDLARKDTSKDRASDTGELASTLLQLAQAAESNRQPSWHRERARQRTNMLKELYEAFERAHSFQPGQIVRWKKGLKNRKRPDYDEPVVVISTWNDPLYDQTQESGSTYFREPLTIILGMIDNDGELISFHFDSRRFEPYEGISEHQDS
jgi:hypothetical protein